MAKAKAPKTTTTTTTTPVNDSKPTKKATKKIVSKKDDSVEVVPEVTNEVVETSAPVAPESTDEVASLSSQMSDLMAIFNRLSTEARSAATKLRALDKQYQRTLRVAQKSSNKKRKNTSGAPRAPSGFVKPTLISKELATFLNKPHGSEMARTEVTKEINSYIRANKLQDQKNGRVIRPDAKLANLLKIGKNDELTYFNLQRYMSPHFAKMGSKATTSA